VDLRYGRVHSSCSVFVIREKTADVIETDQNDLKTLIEYSTDAALLQNVGSDSWDLAYDAT